MKDSHNASPIDSGGRDTALRQMMRPISGYMADDAVREITITRPGVIFTRSHGQWHERHDPKLTFSFLEALVSAMASYNNVNFSPIMSLLLPDGERAQVAQPPAVIDGTLSINIRKHSSVVKTLDELAAEGAFANWVDVSGPMGGAGNLTEHDKELLDLMKAGDILQFLRRAVIQCRNIIVAGKTGSGKTTFARSLIDCVPFFERLLTIEDVHELFLPNHPNRVHMIYGKGAGRMSATECIEATTVSYTHLTLPTIYSV